MSRGGRRRTTRGEGPRRTGTRASAGQGRGGAGRRAREGERDGTGEGAGQPARTARRGARDGAGARGRSQRRPGGEAGATPARLAGRRTRGAVCARESVGWGRGGGSPASPTNHQAGLRLGMGAHRRNGSEADAGPPVRVRLPGPVGIAAAAFEEVSSRPGRCDGGQAGRAAWSGSAVPATRPNRPPATARRGPARGRFPRSPHPGRPGRCPALPLRHHYEYAADLPRGLPAGDFTRPRSRPCSASDMRMRP